MLIKSERFEVEIYSGGYLNWLHLDIGRKRYTLYRDLDGKLRREVSPRPEGERARAERLAAEWEASGAEQGSVVAFNGETWVVVPEPV